MHLAIILCIVLQKHISMHKNWVRIINFMVSFIYQGGIFYAMTAYIYAFKQSPPLEDISHPEKCSLRTLSAFHMKNIIQFWIVLELTYYTSCILCIILILGFSSCFDLKRMKPNPKYLIKNKEGDEVLNEQTEVVLQVEESKK